MKKIFFGADPSIVKWAYTDIIENKDIEYCDFSEKRGSRLRSFLFSRRFQDLVLGVSQIGAKLLYSYLLGYSFLKKARKKEPVLFVFACQYQYFFLTSFFCFIKFLKEQFPKAKFVFYYNDLISTCYPEALGRLKDEFDLILTFDSHEAEEYALTYYGEVYSKQVVKEKYDIEPFDVFYVGSDRGRLDLILDVLGHLLKLGKKCRFYIIDVLPENQSKIQKFIIENEWQSSDSEKKEYTLAGSYLSFNNYCPYPKTLWLIKQCNCILEIVIPGQLAGSLREPESIVYGKKLITNCKSVKGRVFYNENNICLFDSIEEINQKFFSRPYQKVQFDFSPLRLIDFAEQKLF